MIPRMSYLVAQTRDVVEYFRDAAPPFGGLQGASIWFEAAGVPLKWHVPFGVLWDTLSSSSSSALLPWPVTVHFQGFPADEVRLTCSVHPLVPARRARLTASDASHRVAPRVREREERRDALYAQSQASDVSPQRLDESDHEHARGAAESDLDERS